MITLTIDNRTVTVPEGTSVLDAAETLGIVVPHFCYHKALGAVGACRLCAVHVETAQARGVQMSCLVPVEEGMVVNTLEPTAVELRQSVIEWLMVNHPHDCPVCDEGGECQLQDMTIAGGHGIRRYRGNKRTYENQDLGPFIEQEMNRCIQCYRCVRTYRDYFGGSDFGVLGSRQRIFYGRFEPGKLESPFSGNIVDVCPTGVFTDRTYRFRSRIWDLQEADSICPHCSLGCNTIPGARYRELQRVRSGINEEANGYFICDRGRFGSGYVNHPDRPRRPRSGGTETSWDEALRLLHTAIGRLQQGAGGDAIAFLGSARASLETNALLRRWAESCGSGNLVLEAHPERDRTARTVAARIPETVRSLNDVRQADLLLLVGCDPLNEAPMLAAAIRQAANRGAHVAVIDPRPAELPCQASHLALPPERLADALGFVTGGNPGKFSRQEESFLEGATSRLRQAERPIIVGGGDILMSAGVDALLDAAVKTGSGSFVNLSGPNSYGSALLAGDGPCFETVLDGILDGRIRGLVCIESDPFHDYPDPARVQAALSRLEMLVVLDYLPGEAVRLADIFLPTTAVIETSGIFINCEGRMQRYQPVMEPGEPLGATSGGGHPPRSFSRSTPGAEPRPAADILVSLLETEDDFTVSGLIGADTRFAACEAVAAGGSGSRVDGVGSLAPAADSMFSHGEQEGLRLLPVAERFGSGALSRYATALDAVRPESRVIISSADAGEVGLVDGETAILQTSLGKVHVKVDVSDVAVPGLVLLPQIESGSSGAFRPGAGTFPCRLLKEGER